MKALFLYYSNTGNTKLALKTIARNLKKMIVDFYDITKGLALKHQKTIHEMKLSIINRTCYSAGK